MGVTKVAYPRLMPDIATWAQVQAAWYSGDFASMPAALQKAIRRNDPIVVDHDPEGHETQSLIWGAEDVYHVESQMDTTRPKPKDCKGLIAYQVFCWHHERLQRGQESDL